ncbi:MAG: alpha/beta fold hydrolase [bacterium]
MSPAPPPASSGSGSGRGRGAPRRLLPDGSLGVPRRPGARAVHVVRAGRSDRWDAATLQRLAASAVDVRVLPDAGHWLHVDDPEGLLALLDPTFAASA